MIASTFWASITGLTLNDWKAFVRVARCFQHCRKVSARYAARNAEHQHRSADCEGNADQVVKAAEAELAKITLLQEDLAKTVHQLANNSRSLQRRLPKLELDEFQFHTKIREELAPKLRATRTSYSELADKRAEVREALGLYQTLMDLEDRRTALELEEAEAVRRQHTGCRFAAISLDKFSTVVRHILQTWHFPNG